MTLERFTVPELTALRNELAQTSLDARQSAEVLQVFLIGRGYGVSPEAAFDASIRVGHAGCSLEAIQRELEKLALVQ